MEPNGRSPVIARSYLTDVPSIRCWRRDRRSESTFARGDDEPAVTVEFLTPKPNIDRRKVDVRPKSYGRFPATEANVNFYVRALSASASKTPRLRPAHRLRDRKLTRNAGPDANIG